MNRKTVYSLLGAAALTVALTACGDDDSGGVGAGGEDYCDLLQETDDTLSNLDSNSPDDYDQAVSIFEDITAVAPDAVKDDWQTVTDGIRTLTEIDPTADPEGSMETLEGLQELEPASNRIEQHAQDECGIELE